MNTKITLKVKEGPGELIGITEVDANNNEIVFDKIQFSESGSYVISVISSSPDIENTEFTVNVSEQDIFIEQESSEEESNTISENRPYITQIDPPTIDLGPMSLDATNNSEDNSKLKESFGRTPFFWYNGIQIQDKYIQKLELYFENMVPKAKVTFIDALGIINSDETMPLSNTKFEIFLNSNSSILKSIHLRFKIEVNQLNRNKSNTITGIIDIPDFYKVDYKSYNMSSFDALREICKEHNLGFNSNIDQTDDQMNWIKNGVTSNELIKTIISNSYLSDNSFTYGYIDYYWSLNYIDIEKEWLRDTSNDVGINSTSLSSLPSNNELDKLTPLILSNDESLNYSGFGFKSNYRINNNSTKKNSKKGTYTKVKYYDRTSKQFIEFNIDSLDSDQQTKVILKGEPGEKSELSNYRTSYSGKMDLDNLHRNYLYASEHNKRNLNNLTNITIELELNDLNFNLYRFQKIKVLFVNQKRTITFSNLTNERLSGDWIITDISFIFNGKENKQKLVIARKDLNKLSDEIENQITEDNNVNNSEFNDNPTSDDNTTSNQNFNPSPLLTPLGNKNEKRLSDSDLKEFAKEFNLELAVVKSVIEVESSGSGFYDDGRTKILFEGHEFWRQLKKINIKPEKVVNNSNRDILYEKWTKLFYGKEYRRLERAMNLIPGNNRIPSSALESTSWGLFQIMGYHYKSLGYPSVENFVEKMQKSEKEHLIAFGKYLKENRLLDTLRKKDWTAFAKKYNGPAYAQNKYDTKLETAYLKYKSLG